MYLDVPTKTVEQLQFEQQQRIAGIHIEPIGLRRGRKYRPVRMLSDPPTTFQSIADAAKAIGMSNNAIRYAIENGKMCEGFYWEDVNK